MSGEQKLLPAKRARRSKKTPSTDAQFLEAKCKDDFPADTYAQFAKDAPENIDDNEEEGDEDFEPGSETDDENEGDLVETEQEDDIEDEEDDDIAEDEGDEGDEEEQSN
jgi:hypothetical protein